VYLPSVARRQAADFRTYVLEFTRDDQERSARLSLTVDGADSKAFGRCGRLSLAILHDGDIDDVPAEVASLASWVVALLRLKSTADLELQLPASLAEMRGISYPRHADDIEARVEETVAVAEAPAPPPALNLALDPDCGQRCVFCSVKSYVTPTDAGDADFDDVRMQLQQAERLGVREVRLNGIDPLQHSRVLDVLDEIRELGFPSLTVFSPARRLADAAFRREFLRRVPPRFKVSIPLYGMSEETHDTVTGTKGSYREVLAAIEGLRQEGASEAVQISTVFVKQNVHEIVPMLSWIKGMGLGEQVHAHLPYPMRPTTRDPYVDSAMRESELMARLLQDVQALPAADRSFALSVIVSAFPHPCVRWEAEQRTGMPALGGSFPDAEFPLAGTEYRSGGFVHASGTKSEGDAFAVAVVECPRAAECALAAVCPKEHYSVYAERYGLDEYAAVRPSDLYGASPVADSGRAGVWSIVKDAWRAKRTAPAR
jgi:molybdenum cofactor biosynthesis enzyme MoaA